MNYEIMDLEDFNAIEFTNDLKKKIWFESLQ